jgi:hypothetical protein
MAYTSKECLKLIDAVHRTKDAISIAPDFAMLMQGRKCSAIVRIPGRSVIEMASSPVRWA